MDIKLTLDGNAAEAKEHELLIELLQRRDTKVPAVCYHHQLGPIQTCDTCLVEVNGKLVRACATPIVEGMEVATKSPRADAAQRVRRYQSFLYLQQSGSVRTLRPLRPGVPER